MAQNKDKSDEDSPGYDRKSNPFLLSIILIILAVIVLWMGYRFYYTLQPRQYFDHTVTEKEFETVNRIEERLVFWVQASVLVVTIGILVRKFETHRVLFAILFTIVGICMLISANFTYMDNKEIATSFGYEVPARVDMLFVLVIVILIIAFFMLYDLLVDITSK